MSYKIDRNYSPNKTSRNGWKPDVIVSHITEGNYAGAVSWLCNPQSKASSHFVVSKKGQITQLVDIKDAAWINGTSTDVSKSNHFSKSSLKLVRDRKTNANYYSIGIEHEGFFKDAKGALTPEQLKATIWLHKYIREEVKRIYGTDIPLDREHIVGHYQIDPIRKPNCPGSAFQFNEIIKELKGVDIVNKPIAPTPPINNNIPSTWAKEAWEWAVKNKLTDGTSPKTEITREQVVTILFRYNQMRDK